MKNYLLFSEPMKIGKHEWRLIVYQGDRVAAPEAPKFVDYEWRDPAYTFHGGEVQPAGRWQDMEKWPRYDHNDGSFAGCPRTLRKLYEKHRAQIKQVMEKTTP